MSTPFVLDAILHQLAARTPEAQQRWEAGRYADEDNQYDEDDEIEGELWLSLEWNGRTWSCGYRVQQDEATVWAFREHEGSPLRAAEKLLKRMDT